MPENMILGGREDGREDESEVGCGGDVDVVE